MAASLIALAACVPQAPPEPAKSNVTARLIPQPAARAYAVPPAPLAVSSAIEALGRQFNGRAGIAVRDVRTGWVASYNGASSFPQQSVSKLWVAITLMDAVDRGEAVLNEPLTVRTSDLTVFHQPIRALIGKNGYNTTLEGLLRTALTMSDNTANDMLLRRVGGPEAVRAMLARKGLGGIGFGPGEKLLQASIAGLIWQPGFSAPGAFQQARAALPMAMRMAAMDRYLSQPVDGASPLGITAALARLESGTLLSPASTARLIGIMRECRTGAARLRKGLAPGWTLAHKTGTGQELAGMTAGYNDVGLVTAPDGRTYAIAVMIGSTRVGIPARSKLMTGVMQAVIDNHGYQEASRGGPMSAAN
jgi:beta-lactamase class A